MSEPEPTELPPLPENCYLIRARLYAVTFPRDGHKARYAKFLKDYPELSCRTGGFVGPGLAGEDFGYGYFFIDKYGRRDEESLSGAFK